jgi:lipopolysaccharide assembly outer membrane protein LptD (OstA)
MARVTRLDLAEVGRSGDMGYNHAMNRLSLGILFIACSGVFVLGQAVKPDEIPVTIQATTQVVTGPVVHLKGSAQVTTDQNIISADEIDFNVITGDIEARGNVKGHKIGVVLPTEKPAVNWTMHRMNIYGKKMTSKTGVR